jgi:hypothetical protein
MTMRLCLMLMKQFAGNSLTSSTLILHPSAALYDAPLPTIAHPFADAPWRTGT